MSGLQKPGHDKKRQLRQTNLNLRWQATGRRNTLLLVSPVLRIGKGSTTGASVFAAPRAGIKFQARRFCGAVHFRARERNRADVNKGAAVAPLPVYGAFGEMIEADAGARDDRAVSRRWSFTTRGRPKVLVDHATFVEPWPRHFHFPLSIVIGSGAVGTGRTQLCETSENTRAREKTLASLESEQTVPCRSPIYRVPLWHTVATQVRISGRDLHVPRFYATVRLVH